MVTGSASLAKRYNVPDIIIGLTIVAFGTSTPELVVNLIANYNGTGDLAIGNVLGSNIANILLILGTSAMIYPIVVKQNTVWKELPFSLLAAIVLLVMVSDTFLNDALVNTLSRADGLILLCFFTIFLHYTLELAKSRAASLTVSGVDGNTEEMTVRSVWQSAIYIVLGLVGLFLGGQWIVDGAVHIASTLGLSQSLIGLTIVAVGTSLPELAASAMAAVKHKTDIAVGNVVGSNIFNVLWILGISSVVRPLNFTEKSYLDLGVNLVATIFLFAALFVGKRHVLERWQGVLFFIGYFAYIVFLVIQDLGLI